MRCLLTGHKGRILVRAPRKSKALLEKSPGQEGGGDLFISVLGMPAASDHGTRTPSAGQARYRNLSKSVIRMILQLLLNLCVFFKYKIQDLKKSHGSLVVTSYL
jgi:hypothetical protein